MDVYLYRTSLPFFLRLKDDKYEACYNNTKYEISTYKVWTKFAEGSNLPDEYENTSEPKVKFSISSPEFSDSIKDFA